MSTLEIRPRFRRIADLTPDAFLERMNLALADTSEGVTGTINENYLTLRLPTEDQHFWSPVLNLSVHPHEHGSSIRGLCGPRPSVWLMFVFFYSFLGFAAMIIMVMGFSQLNLGLGAGILWLLPVIGLVIGLMYLTARAGQRMAREEMHRLFDVYFTAMQGVTILDGEGVTMDG